MSKNRYRNPDRDKYYEDLEKELREKVNPDREEIVVKNDGFYIEKTPEEAPEKEKPKAKTEESPEEGNWKKRYGDLRRHLSSKEKEFQEKEQAMQAEIDRLKSSTVSSTPELPANMTDEKIEEWKKKFPDVANIIDYMAQKRAKEIASGLEEKVSVLEESKKVLDHQRAYLMLLEHHEDFDKIRQSEDFRDWLELQDDEFKNAIIRPRGYDEASVRKAARVIDFFKLETGWGKTEEKAKPQKKDTSAASTVPSRGSNPEDFDSTPRFTESQIAKMSSSEFMKNKDAILEAQRKGPPYFTYDMTGAAR